MCFLLLAYHREMYNNENLYNYFSSFFLFLIHVFWAAVDHAQLAVQVLEIVQIISYKHILNYLLYLLEMIDVYWHRLLVLLMALC